MIALRKRNIIMRRCGPAVILCLILSFLRTPAGFAQRPPALRDTGGVLGRLSIASFTGSSQDSIQAVATDANGDIYVAGTTFSPQFPVKNAEQPVFGDARILRTTDLGATWTWAGFPPGNVTVLVADPVSPQVLFAGGPNGIYKSTDSGQTWQVVYPFTGGNPNSSVSLAIDPGNHLRLAAITPSVGLIRSLDGGETWTPGGSCPFSACAGQLIADPTGSGALLTTFNLSISRDWGLTFEPLRPPAPGTPSTAAFDPSNPGWIYADVSGGSAGTLWLSTDYGSTWTAKASPPTTFTAIQTLAVDPNQSNILVAATADGLYKSSDGAASWTLQRGSNFMPETEDPFVMVPHTCIPSGGLLAINGAVAFSPDFGVTWTTPQLSNVTSVAAGPGCTFYVTGTTSSDAFVAKIASDGAVQWTTFLGGSDTDAAVALVLDQQGNVYVAGNTSSPDFPTSVAHIGPQGENSVFITKFSPGGQVIYSATLGGESASTAVALAVDVGQNTYIVGTTNSTQFPVTPGVIVTSSERGSSTGFLAKLSSDAALTYATYLGESYTDPGAILVDANEEAIIAGTGVTTGPAERILGFIMKVNGAASQVLSATNLPVTLFNITGLAADAQNNLVVLGEAEAPPAPPGGFFIDTAPSLRSGDVWGGYAQCRRVRFKTARIGLAADLYRCLRGAMRTPDRHCLDRPQRIGSVRNGWRRGTFLAQSAVGGASLW
ncbi:MAG: SBBP repeat-containing protein [Bryobacteraceae bacterium]